MEKPIGEFRRIDPYIKEVHKNFSFEDYRKLYYYGCIRVLGKSIKLQDIHAGTKNEDHCKRTVIIGEVIWQENTKSLFKQLKVNVW